MKGSIAWLLLFMAYVAIPMAAYLWITWEYAYQKQYYGWVCGVPAFIITSLACIEVGMLSVFATVLHGWSVNGWLGRAVRDRARDIRVFASPLVVAVSVATFFCFA